MQSLFRRVIGAWLTVMAAAVCGVAVAQSGGDDAQGPPQFAMGSGRMVRGTITAVAADKLSLRTQQGDIYTVALTANTQLRHGRDQMKISDVHVGDGAGAMGEVDQPNKTVHALFVAVLSAEDLKKAHEAMGKTFISGTVTAIDETKLTIMRTDQVSQVIEVDEDTSFRRGGRGLQMALGDGGTAPAIRQGRPDAPATAGGEQGESITLGDVKVGDLVAGPGKIKNGFFTPTQLGVSDPARQRRRGGASNAGGAGSGAATGTGPRGSSPAVQAPPPEMR